MYYSWCRRYAWVDTEDVAKSASVIGSHRRAAGRTDRLNRNRYLLLG